MTADLEARTQGVQHAGERIVRANGVDLDPGILLIGARLLTLEQTGHELPRRDWSVVVPAILRHTS
jgi:hypothetical protein